MVAAYAVLGYFAPGRAVTTSSLSIGTSLWLARFGVLAGFLGA